MSEFENRLTKYKYSYQIATLLAFITYAHFCSKYSLMLAISHNV